MPKKQQQSWTSPQKVAGRIVLARKRCGCKRATGSISHKSDVGLDMWRLGVIFICCDCGATRADVNVTWECSSVCVVLAITTVGFAVPGEGIDIVGSAVPGEGIDILARTKTATEGATVIGRMCSGSEHIAILEIHTPRQCAIGSGQAEIREHHNRCG